MQRAEFNQWSGAAALALATLVLWIVASLGGDNTTLIVVDLANLAAALLAAYTCAWRGFQETGRPRRGWKALGVACFLWAIGVAYIGYYDLWVERGVAFADREIPFPSIADIGFLGFVPFALVGVLLVPTGIFRRQARLENAIDGLLVALSVLIVVWVILLRDMAAQDLGSALDTGILLAYPLGDVLLAATALCAWQFVSIEERKALLLVAVGLAFLAAADVGFFILVMKAYVGISPINALWPAGFLCLALAAVRPLDSPKTESTEASVPTPGIIPLTVAAGTIAIGLTMADGNTEPVLAVLGTLLAAGVATRFAVARLEKERVRRVAAELGHQNPRQGR